MHTVFVPALNPMPAVFPTGVFPAVNPAMSTAGLFAPTGGPGSSAYTDISSHRMMFPPPEFHVTPMYAAPAQNGVGSSGSLPPAGNGNGGSNGSDGKGRKKGAADPFEAATELRRMIPETMRSDELTKQVGTALQGFATVSDKLRYIGNVAALLESIPLDTIRFSPLALTGVAHYVANRADELTGYVTPGGVTVQTGVDEANMLKPLFNFVVRLERKLLQDRSLTTDASLMIAGVHFIFVRKGMYTYVLKDSAAGEKPSIGLISTVLHLLDIIKRYDAAGVQRDARFVRAFLEEVRNVHGIPQDALKWAIDKYHELMDGNFTALSAMKDEPDILEAGIRPLDLAVVDFTRGLYLFSPQIYKRLSAGLEEIGLGEYAERYAKRAEEEYLIASQLGLVE